MHMCWCMLAIKEAQLVHLLTVTVKVAPIDIYGCTSLTASISMQMHSHCVIINN